MKNTKKCSFGVGSMLNNTKSNKTRNIITITLAVVLVALFIGGSYALWTYNFTGGENVIETDSISLELLESEDEVISIENALPMADKDGIAQSEAFSFAVTTRTEGVTDIYYNLKIEKVSVDSGYTAFSDNDIKIYLTDDNDKALIAPRKIGNLNDYIFYKTYNKHTGDVAEVTTKYKLKSWIDFDVDASNWNANTKLQYKFKIKVDGEEYNSNLVNLSNKVLPEGAYYGNINWDTGESTLYNEIPETVNESDIYIYGDYIYEYALEDFGGWVATLATEGMFEEYGLTELLPNYPLVDLNRTSYAPILDNIDGSPLTGMWNTFSGATSLAEPPVIPKSVTISEGIFEDCTSLKSDTNIYSYPIDGLNSGSNLDVIENYTTEYKSLNKSVFLKHNIGSLGRIETQEVCYILNGKKHCLKGGVDAYYEENKRILLETFGEDHCSVNSDNVDCSLSGLYAYAYAYGYVDARDSDWRCYVSGDGYANCIE